LKDKRRKGKHYDKPINRKRNKSNKKNRVLALIICAVFILNVKNIGAYLTAFSSLINSFSIEAQYTVKYENNTGSGTMGDQTISYNVDTPLTKNTFTKEGYIFNGWNTDENGNGTYYEDEQAVNNLGNTVLYAQWILENVVAEIDGQYYVSLQEAINDVPTNNTKTTIKVLRNISLTSGVIVAENQNIEFNIQNFKIDMVGSSYVIENHGTILIQNGTITSSAAQAIINNESDGVITITGGSLIASGTKQALYNNGGIATISGNAYLSATSSNRPAAHNLLGTMTISGGTIYSSKYSAVVNTGTLTIGTEDGNVDKTSPSIQGAQNGVNSTMDFDFFDGSIKGKNAAINNNIEIQNKEDGYDIVNTIEKIDNINYKEIHLGIIATVTFDPGDGSVSETSREVEIGLPVGILPTPTRNDHSFIGWFTQENGGDEVTDDTIVTENITLYAHWEEDGVAEISGTKYKTVQLAVDAVPKNNTKTIIKILKDVKVGARIKILAGQNIEFDMQDHTFSTTAYTPIIENYGTLKLSNGTFTSSSEQGIINNEPGGNLTITGGRYLATGTRQVLYNHGGTSEITGTAYLSATTAERATVTNLSGTVKITGGKIFSSGSDGVSNEATCIVGKKDGNVDTSSPVIQGERYGFNNTGTFNFYDGIIVGKTDSINGSIDDIESGYSRKESTENIDGIIYKSSYLEID